MKMSYTFCFSHLLVGLLLLYSATFAFGATHLPEDEVQALKDIAKTLGKTNWNFSADPCGSDYGWANLNSSKDSKDAVTCNCTLVPNSTVCHVTSIKYRDKDDEDNALGNSVSSIFIRFLTQQAWGCQSLSEISSKCSETYTETRSK